MLCVYTYVICLFFLCVNFSLTFQEFFFLFLFFIHLFIYLCRNLRFGFIDFNYLLRKVKTIFVSLFSTITCSDLMLVLRSLFRLSAIRIINPFDIIIFYLFLSFFLNFWECFDLWLCCLCFLLFSSVQFSFSLHFGELKRIYMRRMCWCFFLWVKYVIFVPA